MSSYQAQIALRFEVRPHDSIISKSDWLEVDKTDVQRLQELFWFVESYETDLGDGFYARMAGGKVFIDYMLTDEKNCYDIDLDIPSAKFEKIAGEFARKFILTEDLTGARDDHPIILDEKLKVLYFYNGACAGMREVA